MKKHKDYLCPGEMQWSKIPGRFGTVSGWKCSTCGRTLPSHVHSLQHVAGMNAPSSIPGILDEYCWKHEPGGWTCEVCWLHIHLAAFFEAVAMIASESEVGK